MIFAVMISTAILVSCTDTTPVPEKYTVSFDSNGGSPVASQQVERGKCAAQPKDPVKEGYDFVRWELDGKAYDFAAPVTKSITLKASWKESVKPEPTPEPTPEPKFVFNETLKDDLNAVLAETDKGYNTDKGEVNGIYTAEEFGNLVEGFSFYVPVGKATYEAIDNLTIGESFFDSSDTISISMGNSRYIEDYVYLYDDGELFVAAPVFMFETIQKAQLTINGEVYAMEGVPASTETEITDVFWNKGSNSIYEENGVYTAVFNEDTATDFLAFEFAAEADHFLTKKTYFEGNGIIGYNYGYTGADTVGGKNVLGFYPLGWSNTSLPDVGYDSIGYSVCLFDAEGKVYHKNIQIDISIPNYVLSKTILSDIGENMLKVGAGYNVSGGEAGGEYTEEEFKAFAPGFSFYTEIGKVRDDVKLIEFADDSFLAGDVVKVSMGNKRFVVDDAFKVVNGKLYVATPIAAFELLIEPTFVVAGNGWDENVDFVNPVISEAVLKDVQWQTGSTNTVDFEESYELYSATVKFQVNDAASNKWLAFQFDPQSEWYLTQKLYLDANGDLMDVTYGYTEADSLGGNNVLALYPLSFSNTEVAKHEWETILYKAVFADAEGVPYGKTILISEK